MASSTSPFLIKVNLETEQVQRMLRAAKLAPRNVARAFNATMRDEAYLWSAAMKMGIRAGRPGSGATLKPLKNSTLITRQMHGFAVGGKIGNKPLIQTGELVRSIGFWQRGTLMRPLWFIGIREGTLRRGQPGAGKDLAMIAATLETGRKFTISAARLGPVAANRVWHFLRHLADADGLRHVPRRNFVLRINIPARPFVRPTHDRMVKGLPGRVIKGLARRLHEMRFLGVGAGKTRKP